MYDPEAIEAMSTPELARLLDRLSERELKSVLIFMTGAAPRTVAHALNFVKDGGAETLVRQSGRAAEPAPVITDSEAAGMLAAAIITGTPVLVTGDEATWCPGTTFMEHEEVTLYCDRDAGHDGSHHAPGPDEGSEVAWSDEPASSEAECALPRPRPADRCKCGHIALYHHLNLVTGETVYCNECPGVDDCAAFSPAEPATVAS